MAYIAPTTYEELNEQYMTERFLKLEAYAMLNEGRSDYPRVPTPEDFRWMIERIRWYDDERDRLLGMISVLQEEEDTDDDLLNDDYPDE